MRLPNLLVRSALLVAVVRVIFVPQFVLAQDCSRFPNSHYDHDDANGTHICECNGGFGEREGKCVAKVQLDCIATGGDWDGRRSICNGRPTVDVPRISGSPLTTRQLAFPGLTDEQWNRLKSSPEGGQLIKQADDL